MRLLRLLPALSLLLLLAACGGSDGGSAGSADQNTPATITGVGCYFENLPSDYTGSADQSLGLNVTIFFTGTKLDNIVEAEIDSPTGWSKTIPANLDDTDRFGTTSNGLHFYGGRLFNDNGHTFPLAGIWKATLTLENGNTVSREFKLHEPGTTDNATTANLYTKEDWSAPEESAIDYVQALPQRFPVEGVTVSRVGNVLTSLGLAGARADLTPGNETHVYNSLVWMYTVEEDGSIKYVGRSLPEFSYTDHSRSGWMPRLGEMSLPQASTVSSSDPNKKVDLATVKFVRFVYTDGKQYATNNNFGKYDIRSVSQLVPVE